MSTAPANSMSRSERVDFVRSHDWAEVRHLATRFLSLGGLAAFESAADLVSESEMHGKVPERDHLPEQLRERLAKAGHPLAWLPPRLTPMERGFSRWESPETREQPHSLPHGDSVDIVCTSQPPAEALAAFESIIENSNGRAAAISGELTSVVEPNRSVARAIADVFAPLAPPRHAATVAFSVSPRAAVWRLLDIAVSGGAYDRGGGILGRLGAWHTLAYMVGTRSKSTFDEVQSAVERAAWLEFAQDGLTWFDDGVWQGALACLRFASTEFAAVAWTDTD